MTLGSTIYPWGWQKDYIIKYSKWYFSAVFKRATKLHSSARQRDESFWSLSCLWNLYCCGWGAIHTFTWIKDAKATSAVSFWGYEVISFKPFLMLAWGMEHYSLQCCAHYSSRISPRNSWVCRYTPNPAFILKLCSLIAKCHVQEYQICRNTRRGARISGSQETWVSIGWVTEEAE